MTSTAALAGDGQPSPWQIGFQEPASPIMRQIVSFHDGLLVPLITVISLFVLALLVYVMWRFSEKRNPEPSRVTHNTLLEVLWTGLPVIILVAIAVPSLKLLYAEDVVPEADMTIKASGGQWFWNYSYPDHGDITFDAYMKADDDLEEGEPRLLTTDNDVVLPINTKIRILVTATDVLHSFALPSMGVKVDAVPGRINETWMEIERAGMYYGQCSEICGTNHAFMPITVRAVPMEEFEAWVAEQTAAMQAPDGSDSTQLAATPAAE